MAKTPTDEQAQEFQLRTNTDPFAQQGWRGVNTQRNPGSIAPNELQVGDDIRLVDGDVFVRPPIQAMATLDGPIRWMHEAPVDNPHVRLWGSNLGCFGVGPGLGATIVHVDPGELPVYQVYGNYKASGSRLDPLAKFGSSLFVGDRTALRELVQTTAPPGAIGTTIPAIPAAATVTFPGFKIRCLLEFDSKLFIGLENEVTPTASKIAIWDGLAWKDDLTGIRPPIAFGTWRDKLVAGFDATAANVRVRDPGAAPGTWATVGLAGFLTGAFGNVMCEVGPKLFIASGTDLLHSFDGTSLALTRTVAGCAVDGFGITALTKHNGLLHYGWNTPSGAPGYSSRIGRHDPDSSGANEFVDTYLDITAQQANFIILQSMASYRKQIYCGGNRTWVVRTKEHDLKGTLEVVASVGVGAAGFGLQQLMKYP